jgi:Cof subfamily protein (haloacid dehalogenase superfamily)
MSIKLVAIDLDGTLFDEHKLISKEVQSAIGRAKAQGVKIVLCTGRPLTGSLSALKQLNLLQKDDYCITYNGAYVQHNFDGKVIFRKTLTHQDFISLEQLSRDIGVHCHTLDMNQVYTTNRDISPYTIRECFMSNMALSYRTVEEMDPTLDILKVMMIDEEDVLDRGIAKIPASFFEKYTILKSERFYLELLNKEASKGKGVANLAEYLGIHQSEIMAIGDNENDMDMIEYAGIGVAMGNAIDSVKRVSNFITKTNGQHGVAHAIEKFVLTD